MIDATAGAAANDAFTWIGEGNFNPAGQVGGRVSCDTRYLYDNTDDDVTTSEMMIVVVGAAPVLDASALILYEVRLRSVRQ